MLLMTLHLLALGDKLLSHQYRWWAWWLWPSNRTFLKVASTVVTWWIVTFCASNPLHSFVTGTYAGWVTMSGADLHLCQDAANILDSALKFGNKYKKSVSLLPQLELSHALLMLPAAVQAEQAIKLALSILRRQMFYTVQKWRCKQRGNVMIFSFIDIM